VGGAGLLGVVTTINRVTGIYETELAIRLILVANNDLIIYTNADTDPYTNDNGPLMLSQNQSNLDFVIGSVNYDIGHVLNTAGGGLAAVGVVCIGTKAMARRARLRRLETRSTWTTWPTKSAISSVPITRSTARARQKPFDGVRARQRLDHHGVCRICGADDLLPHSDPYFHSASIEEIVAFTTGGFGSACATVSATGNNAPTVSAGSNYTVPGGTPFTLTASGSDPDVDPLTFCWEERDLGPDCSLSTPDNGSSPLFRSFNPSASPARTFQAR
jgi:hypothetical protein